MKHGPTFLWDNARFAEVIPYVDSAINRWHADHEDIEDEMGIVTPQEDVHHEYDETITHGHDRLTHWHLMRMM